MQTSSAVARRQPWFYLRLRTNGPKKKRSNLVHVGSAIREYRNHVFLGSTALRWPPLHPGTSHSTPATGRLRVTSHSDVAELLKSGRQSRNLTDLTTFWCPISLSIHEGSSPSMFVTTTRTARILGWGRERPTTGFVPRLQVACFPTSDWAGCITVTIEPLNSSA
jgi:hypothetical protein